MSNVIKNIIDIKNQYFKEIDNRAKFIAQQLAEKQQKKRAADLIMSTVAELYTSAKNVDFHNDSFESAYHASISADFEFFISRILKHYSDIKKLDWKIYVRRQISGNKSLITPDIRIEKQGKIVAILEIKTRVGWMQPVFNSDTFKKRLIKFNQGILKNDPRIDIEKNQEQINKYISGFKIKRDQMFVLVPTLKDVHRVNSLPSRGVDFYIDNFAKNSKLKSDNLILLSNNLKLNLSAALGKEHQSTDNFEKFILKISKY